MKAHRLWLWISLVIAPVWLYAQQPVEKRLYLFDEFADGRVLFKNGSSTPAKLNYDAANREMTYYQAGELMVLGGTQQIDTVFIAGRKFIPAGRVFLEIQPLIRGELFINWKLKPVYRGKTGVYGVVTQSASVRHINTNYLNHTSFERQTADVYSAASQNEYWIKLADKPVKFKDRKSLLKLFPAAKRPLIEAFMKEHGLDMKKTIDVMETVDYCLSLE